MATKVTSGETPAEFVDPIDTVHYYHDITKHGPYGFAPGPGYLNWDTQPDPFRRYRGAALYPLPFSGGNEDVPFGAVDRPGGVSPQVFSLGALSLFLELGLGLTAWKQINEVKWSLRANPSSGNLHPTEGYLWLPALGGLADGPALYHYAPHEHGLELRCEARDQIWPTNTDAFLIGLSSIPWRESWKYGERAFRYCQHDLGHAMGSLRYAAAALGWSLRWLPEPGHAQIACLLGLDKPLDFVAQEAEIPECIGFVHPAGGTNGFDWRLLRPFAKAGQWAGQARRLSVAQVEWDQLEAVAFATTKSNLSANQRSLSDFTAPDLPAANLAPSIQTVVRRRRSAVDMDGKTGLSETAFYRMLARTLPDTNTVPWDCFPYVARVALFVFVHRVEGLKPGLYTLLRNPGWRDALSKLTHSKFNWRQFGPDGLPFYLLEKGDFIRRAADLSCTQSIAGDSAFSLGMVAQLERTVAEEGAWAYRRLYWECGLIGQVLYLESEAAGIQATGIGCFFDDVMHQTLGFNSDSLEWQSLYHFTVGGAVEDERLSTLAAYHHLPAVRQPIS